MLNDKLSDPESWIDEHGDYLFKYALFRLRDKHVAEDAVQETLLAAFRAGDRFRGQGSERTWLVGILKHKVMDHFRTLGRWQTLELDDENFNSASRSFHSTGELAGHWTHNEAPSAWHTSAEAMAENKEFWEVLSSGLDELSERTAAVFVLREMDGLSTQEICAELGISQENLWVMLHRARLFLRRFLQVNWFTSPSARVTALPTKSTKGTRRKPVSMTLGFANARQPTM
jgi:RNA polymerase sigma-70 factor, ECF subfamily